MVKCFYTITFFVFIFSNLSNAQIIDSAGKDTLKVVVPERKDSSKTASKIVIPEFKQFDTNNDGFISKEEEEFVVEKTLDQAEGFDSKITWRLIQYMDGQLLSNDTLINPKNEEILTAQALENTQTNVVPEVSSQKTFFDKHFVVGAQLTGLYMYGSGFNSAKYDGNVSIPAKAGGEAICLFTVPVDMTFWKGSEFNFTMEYAGGNGVGNGAGMAAYPNALFGFPQGNPYVLRAQYRQNFIRDTTGTKLLQKTNFTIGQFVIQEMFDVNPYAGDPKVDFLNFSHNMLSGWDASTTAYGYSYGVAGSFVFRRSSLNLAAITVDRDAGGYATDWNVAQGHSFNLQYAQQYNLFNKLGTIRFLGFYNSTKSGLYNKFSLAYEPEDSLMEAGVAYFEDTLKQYNGKVGFGIDADMALTENLGIFARYSWNDDKSESFGYTECQQSINAGFLLNMKFIYRDGDKFGLAASYGTLSKEHQNYLKNGGEGFMLGDGNLNYAPEIVGETFYSFNVFENLALTFNYQYAMNAGYNKDRGNTSFYSFRFNLSF